MELAWIHLGHPGLGTLSWQGPLNRSYVVGGVVKKDEEATGFGCCSVEQGIRVGDPILLYLNLRLASHWPCDPR